MNKHIEIIPAEKIHYTDYVQIYNEAFLPKFRFIHKQEQKQESFVDDFGVITVEPGDREFVAVVDGKVLGILSLRHRKQIKVKSNPNLSLSELLKKYGIPGIIKAIILDAFFTYNPPADELYIDSVGVSKDARGMGIGSVLLQYAEDSARQIGCQKLSLQVMFENNRAKDLYEKTGYVVKSNHSFKLLKSTTGYSGAYFMVRDLEASDL